MFSVSSSSVAYAKNSRQSDNSCVAENHLCRLLGDRDDRRVGVTGGDARHHGAIDHPQPRHAVHFEPVAHDGERIMPHAAGTDGFVIDLHRAAQERVDLLIGFDARTRHDLFAVIAAIGRTAEDAA